MEMDTAIRRIQETTRQFARRQLTWFHRQPCVHWVDARHPEQAVDLVQQFLARWPNLRLRRAQPRGLVGFDDQTVEDLEFSTIRQLLEDHCTSDAARRKAQTLEPSAHRPTVTSALAIHR